MDSQFTRTTRRRALLLPLLVALPLAACGDDDDPVDPEPQIAQVQVAPAAVQLDAVGDTEQLAATAVDAQGDVVADVTFTWASDDETVVTVDATGTVTAVGGGEADVTATADGISGSATVTVEPAVASLEITPADTTVRVGDTLSLAASARDANDNPVDGATVAWSSDDASVAAVDTAGHVTAQGTGTATITAESDGVSATATVTVEPMVASVEVSPDSVTLSSLGDTVRLTATAVDAEGDTLPEGSVTWSSSADSVATVSADGTVTAAADGSVTVTASVGGVADSAVVVVAQEVAMLAVTPDSTEVEVGDTAVFVALATDANENPIEDAELTWSSGDTTLATVDSAGRAVGRAEGTVDIIATGETMADTATLVVQPAAPTASLGIVSGDAQDGVTGEEFGEPLVVEILDAADAPVEGATIRWEVLQGSVTLADSMGTSDVDGRASMTVTGGTTTEDAVIQARSPDAGGEPVTFQLRTGVMAVQIVDNAFVDAEGRENDEFLARIAVGDTLRFTYVESGTGTHTVTSSESPEGGSDFDSGTLEPGDTFTFVPETDGTWTFFCEVHPDTMMGATIEVTADTMPATAAASRGGTR